MTWKQPWLGGPECSSGIFPWSVISIISWEICLFVVRSINQIQTHLHRSREDPELWRAPAPYQSKQTPHAYFDPPKSASLLLSGLSALLLMLLDAVRCRSPNPAEDFRMEAWWWQDCWNPEDHQCTPVMFIWSLPFTLRRSAAAWHSGDRGDAPNRIVLIRVSPDQVRRRLFNLPELMTISAHFSQWAAARGGGNADLNFKLWIFSGCAFLRRGGMADADWRCTRLV